MAMPKGTKMNISPEGHKGRSETGRQNLEKWKDENPGTSNTIHGVNNKLIRKRYTDHRTSEGDGAAGNHQRNHFRSRSPDSEKEDKFIY